MQVVLDANLFVSFLLTRGRTISGIFEFWQRGQLTCLVSEEIISEIRQVVERFVAGKLISAEEGAALIRRLKKEGKKVAITSEVKISKDRKDNRYLACSFDGKADYLVTGDRKHLLLLKKIGRTKIVSPEQFIKILS